MSTFDDTIAIRAEAYPDFNYKFLIFLLLCGVLTIFFLLYFNRLFASIVSYGIRTWTWHKYRVHIDIGALQISLLAGRIFFTGLRYHGSNETFLVQHGYVTWRYWLRRVREADIVADSLAEPVAPGKDKNAKLPCRINVSLIGLEWFVYNRSPAYNSVLAGLCESQSPISSSSGVEENCDSNEKPSLRSRKSQQSESPEEGYSSSRRGSRGLNGNAQAEKDSTESTGSFPDSEQGLEIQKRSDLPFLVQLFPIHVDCQKAAAVIGNENTKGVLIVRADTVDADIDASKTQTVDPYRQVFSVQLQHPVIELKENEDFKSDQAARATGTQDSTEDAQVAAKANILRRQRRRMIATLRKMMPPWGRSSKPVFLESATDAGPSPSRVPGAEQWQGLSRYLDDQEQDDKARWSSIEYAAETTVLDCPSATLSVYWDVVSKVTELARRRQSLDFRTSINGDEAPAWGMQFSIKGGLINYGPWTDRRRADLQRVFFPSLCKDASAAGPLPVGSWRVPTQFNLLIEIDDTVTVRVPFREQSKNWRWRGQESQLKQSRSQTGRKWRNRTTKDVKSEAAPQRPAAWLEVKVAANSTVAYEMDMLASAAGYSNTLNVDLRGSELRSTVNQDILWRSGPQRISCDLSNPLSWNALRLWRFEIDSDDLELYILRDHIFLLIDLIDDWSTGPPPEYLVFTPFKYLLNLRLRGLKLYLNVNDANIIDKPTAMDDNAYLILSSPLLTAETCIPIDKFRPEKNSIPFDVRTDTLELDFHAPQWNTQSAFTTSSELGHVQSLVIGGAYHYNATTSPANTDTLVLNVHGDSPSAYLYGFIVRYFLLLKDNYFGDHVHFRTLDEYQEQLQLKEQNPDGETAAGPPNKKSNDMDVILSIKASNIRAMVPTNLYSASQYVQGELASLSVDLRFTNYYMDMELDLTPLSLSLSGPESDLETPNMMSSSTQLFVDGLRVFGHRLFGLPPTEPTYLCNWDVSAGAVSGECTAEFLAALTRGASAFGFTFDDVENALVPYSSLMFDDVTFARVSVESIRIWLHIEEAAFLLSTDTIDITLNDWARSHYSKRANINVPNVQVSCMNAESAIRHKSRPSYPVETEAYLHTDIHLATIGRKLHFTEKRSLQQELVQREDQRTNRTPFLLIPEYLGEFIPEPADPPAQCSPVPPHPVTEGFGDAQSFRSTATSRRSHRLSRQSSFLSFSGSSAQSVRRSRSRHGPAARSYRAAQVKSDMFNADPAYSHQRDSSAFRDQYSMSGESDLGDAQKHTSVAFSSAYFVPYFPLAGARPDIREAPFPNAIGDDAAEKEEFLSGLAADLEDIDSGHLSEEHAYSSVLVEFPSGVSAFVKPSAIRHGTALLSALKPTEPEDLLDSLQDDSMTKIFDLKKEKEANGSIKDLLFRLPKADIRFLNSSSLDSPDPSQEEQDQYDLSISKLALVTRTSSDWEDGPVQESQNSKTSLHLRLGSAELSASERLSGLQGPQAAMMFQIDDVMVSVGAKEVTYFDADIGTIVGSTASGKIEYLASLIHRTGSLATELGRLIEDNKKRHDNRLKFFTYRLLEEGHSTADPAFLIRPSAVLRSAREHLRTYDSWKLMMRLRQIWSTMNEPAKQQLLRDCSGKSPAAPPDAAGLVVAAFQRWRSWDLENIIGAVLLRNIFGRIEEPGRTAPDDGPVLGACRLTEMQFVLDPGPKENKIGIVDVNARVEQKKAGTEDLLPNLNYQNGPLTVLNLCCSEGAVSLNWELCELVDDILRLYNRNQTGDSQSHILITEKIQTSTTRSGPTALHVVLEVMKGSVEVETINLSAKTMSSGLKGSALLYNNSGELSASSLILNCDAVVSDLHSRGQLLGFFHLRDPSVFVSREMQESRDSSIQTVKSAASSRSLKLAIKQDPIVLMGVLDRLLRDEMAQVIRLQKQFPARLKPKEHVKMRERLSTFRFNVSLFLDKYTISVPLLQSLTYTIFGDVARAACAANFGKEIIFDFDVKESSHEMQIDVRNEPRSISLLQFPPTNGRISSHMQQSEHLLTALCSVELIQLDASAVYSLLGALNRPQISSAIEEIQEQTKAIQKHLADALGTDDFKQTLPKATKETGVSLVYNVHLTLAGLQVSAAAPPASDTELASQVLFSLDKIFLQAANRQETQGPILKYPEVYLNMKQIGLDIRRGTRGSMKSCGGIGAGVTVSAGARRGSDGKQDWTLDFRSPDVDISLSPETVSTALVVLAYLRQRIMDLDTSRELDYLRKLRQTKPRIKVDDRDIDDGGLDILDSVLSTLVYHFELQNIRVCWDVAKEGGDSQTSNQEDLVLSIKMIQFATRTKKSARLTIENFQIQTVPRGQDKTRRSLHSALLPEVIFNIAYVSTANARRMAFQAVGQSLNLRLTSGFIVPAASLVESISLSIKNVQEVSAGWTIPRERAKREDEARPPERPWNLFGKKRLESLLIDADFAGSVVHVSGKRTFSETARPSKFNRPSLAGKYGQFNADDSGSGAVLRSPGLAWKVQFTDNGQDDPTLSGEIKIDASSNILYPSVVPLILDIVASVQEVVSKDSDKAPAEPQPPPLQSQKTGDENNILTTDPSTVLGRTKLNLGLRICRQEFSLSCQPIARVAATACFDNIYFIANTVTSSEHGNFFAISGTFTNIHTSIQHVYSRESTGSFEIDKVTLSFMNSKHVSGTSGVSAILNISPMKVSVNAKQVQDFLLFHEIWYPAELRRGNTAPVAKLVTENSQGHLVQRYQQVAATAAFPWTATISIAALDVAVDMGQAIGKSVFQIADFWVSSKKTSDWEQNLCLGFHKIGVDCTGRLSGFVTLQDFKLRTAIQWPKREEALNETPLVLASIGFKAFRVKAAFDYQAFLVADITTLEFLMYNVRDNSDGRGDRLVAIFDGEAVQIFGTTGTTSQFIALYQAIKKLIQERRENFQSSLKEIEKFMKRKSTSTRYSSQPSDPPKSPEEETLAKSPISLDTDVVVTLKALNLGVFPNTFSDHQVFKMEALNAYARFAASIEHGRVHSILKMTLGQLRIGLAGVRNVEAPKTVSEISVDDVVQRATGSRGGTILKVPQVSAVMETWQTTDSNTIDYIFKSAFEGKVEVGWNYSRISYIRGMWAKHSQSLEQTWGRELPMAAVKITGVPESEGEHKEGEQQKITAEVKVPQSKYNYRALEPPIIETPQLRDMGEATPPLEWIGLHRDRLPNLTHQIVIVSLLELAGEVEDAYSRILGAS
ncbi:Macrophage colony-stimulating factor 1 receptor [Amphichorda felina]